MGDLRLRLIIAVCELELQDVRARRELHAATIQARWNRLRSDHEWVSRLNPFCRLTLRYLLIAWHAHSYTLLSGLWNRGHVGTAHASNLVGKKYSHLDTP